jgi:hypothetical protein
MGFSFGRLALGLATGGLSEVIPAVSGVLGGDAAEEAARIQAAAGERALTFGEEQVAPFRDIGIAAGEQLPGAQFQGFQDDPGRVLNNPLFKALAGQQEQRLINQQAALGRGGSGETNDLLTKNLLLLGRDFQQQDFQNQLAENQTQFGQLFDQTRLGANVSTQQATSGQNIIQGIGDVQAAGEIGKSNVLNNLIEQGIGIGTAVLTGGKSLPFIPVGGGGGIAPQQ